MSLTDHLVIFLLWYILQEFTIDTGPAELTMSSIPLAAVVGVFC